VADVPVAVEKRKSVSVEEAVERKPFKNARVVEVACSLVESLVKGQVIPPEADPQALPVEERMPPLEKVAQPSALPFRSKLPVTAKLVEEPLVKRVVARVVEPERVEEAVEIKPFPKTSVVEVESSPVPNFVKGKAKLEPVPEPQASAATANKPLLSTCTHLVPLPERPVSQSLLMVADDQIFVLVPKSHAPLWNG